MSVRILVVVTTFFIGTTFFTTGSYLYGQDDHQEEHSHEGADSHDEEFNAPEYILDHIADSHEWHLLTKKDGHHVAVPLPVILYSKHSGFHLFFSSKIAHGHSHEGFQMGHGSIQVENKKGVLVEKSL